MKSVVLLTLVLEHPLQEYPALVSYLSSFDWCYVCPPTATTYLMLLHAETSVTEIKATLIPHFEPNDSCLVQQYEPTDATLQLINASSSCRDWLNARNVIS